MDDYIFLLDEFKKFGGLAIEISGEGEPLLPQTNTLQIVRYATNLGIWTTLITNGLSLTHEIITELKSLKVALVISLHSLKKGLYEKDNGFPGSFEIVMKNIGSVSDIFQNTSWQENGFEIKRACIHWTLQADNISEIPAIREFCHSKDLHFSIAPLANVGSASSSPEILLTEGFSNLEEINNQGDESIIFYDEPSGRKVCGTCKYGLNIGADGDILLDAHGGYEVKIANIRDISFPKALELQHAFSQRMFSELYHYCPVRDPGWRNFVQRFTK